MSLLIDIRDPSWMEDTALRDVLAPLLPGVAIHCGPGNSQLADVTMIAVVKLHDGMIARLPNLQLVQKLGAGVDGILSATDLPPDVRIARLAPDAPAREIAEYCLAYVLRNQRHMTAHADDSAKGSWQPKAPRQSTKTTIAVLGLGHIGGWAAKLFASLDFNVIGWSRSPKSLPGMTCRAGLSDLPEVLGNADYVVSILPSTPETRDLFDAETLRRMKPSAVLINAGRGDLVVDEDLLVALNAGNLSGAVLDVFRQEPLPKDHPYWAHPKVTVTPHVSGWHLDDGLVDVAENYRRLSAGKALLHEVDRTFGY